MPVLIVNKSGGISIGDAVGSGTSGSVLFIDSSGNLAQDNAAFYWNDTNHRLGIGTNSPSDSLELYSSSGPSPAGIRFTWATSIPQANINFASFYLGASPTLRATFSLRPFSLASGTNQGGFVWTDGTTELMKLDYINARWHVGTATQKGTAVANIGGSVVIGSGYQAGSTAPIPDGLLVQGRVSALWGSGTATNERFGAASGNDAATGDDNYAFGNGVLSGVTSGNQNVGMGSGVLRSCTTGAGNMGIGTFSLYYLTTGGSNISVGVNSNYVTSGSFNIAIGGSVLHSISTQSGNTAVGHGSLFASTGDYGTAIGYGSQQQGSGGYNTTVGSNSMYYYGTGIENVAIGYLTAERLYSGNGNTVVGTYALRGKYLTTSGSYNSIYGYGAMGAYETPTTASYNAAFGYYALYSITTGSKNAYFGGNDSAVGTLTTGSFNTVLGYNADTSASDTAHAIAIGYGAVAATNELAFDTALTKITLPAKITTYNAIATAGYGVAAIVSTLTLTNQSADITTTNFTNAGTAGLYRVSYSLADTTSDITAGTVTLTIAFTDDAGATTATASQVLTGTGRASGTVYVQLASGNITYATSHTGLFGSAKYALYATVERLN